MKDVVVYTKSYCSYCTKAKSLLKRKGVSYKEIDVEGDDQAREEMIQLSRRQTVPQIFVGTYHVGGCDDLYRLNERGELDKLLFS
ncbi:MAG: glutaredoxin 3 [Nitrospira sp.]|nr:glutaredoxin 3 [Nitrospira sp.]